MKKEISVGGQAVIEGVMMRGPERLATAIRRKNGDIELKLTPFVSITQKKKFLGLPIIRGFVSLIEMMKIGLSTLNFSAGRYELDFIAEEEAQGKVSKKKIQWIEKGAEIGSYILAFGLAFLLFGLLPYKLADWLRLSNQDFFFNLFAGSIRIVFFVLYVWLISLMKDVKRLFRYHGAEHKNVNAYEHNSNLQINDIQTYTTIHPRCGTSFMFFVLLVGILIFSITDALVSHFILKSAIPIYLRLGYHLLMIPIISGVSYEVLKFSGKNLTHPLVKFMTVPGMALQRITTQPPDDDMIETALVAMKAALDMDYSEHKVTLLEG
ncbi:MAG: DUF1385 domain-containing protein [Candidatus Cloacimonetes bacterium]|jgi:uncharacterized protein YqhQ|nr:DUF1385 domain-containing protein [Candidatus Cloacimonadota bacterium]MCB5286776.1 DUF1385 domain-containing protein [Candidatus Cloacimonadota bacterium]MCK9185039.1 DUF1385 domain-containing protein [Candidatus Cloacimonadota bacterium]MCK9584683.1 DUF1385 domain-containing protein [Candidatus Cloacimonadota bacterium]MDY0229098.1 DUF1385 domain-containing protein [Candidatus Cloacimonadaceae bacterium]